MCYSKGYQVSGLAGLRFRALGLQGLRALVLACLSLVSAETPSCYILHGPIIHQDTLMMICRPRRLRSLRRRGLLELQLGERRGSFFFSGRGGDGLGEGRRRLFFGRRSSGLSELLLCPRSSRLLLLESRTKAAALETAFSHAARLSADTRTGAAELCCMRNSLSSRAWRWARAQSFLCSFCAAYICHERQTALSHICWSLPDW